MRLALAGGGTGGHIIPNISLIQELKSRYSSGHSEQGPKLELLYFGSTDGMEKAMVEKLGIPYKGIHCGKWRRYFSWQNFADIFKVPLGIMEAFLQLRSFKPHAIFCKGGYVSFPVAFAGWLLRIPVLLHESDLVPGLSNKMCARFATKICVSFEESKKYFPQKKVVVTGTPVRPELADGSKEEGRKFTGLSEDLPVLLFMGGSQGADFINTAVWQHLNRLLSSYQVIHVCGEKKSKDPHDLYELLTEDHKKYLSHYRAFSFVESEMKDLYALADLIITRSGANTLAEIEFIHKPAILIPLGKKASRGDQIDNAYAYAKVQPAIVMPEEEFEEEKFFEAVKNLLKKNVAHHKGAHRDNSATDKIIRLLESV